jgi:deoxycytidine triphosphate deaminase
MRFGFKGRFIEMAPFRIPKELSYIIIQVTDDPEDAISAENPFEERTTYILGPNTMLKKYKEIVNSFKDKGFNMKSKSTLAKTGKVGYWVNSRAVKAEFEGSTRDKKTYVYVDFYGHNINEDGTPLNPNLDEYGQPKVQQQDVNKTEESKDNQ